MKNFYEIFSVHLLHLVVVHGGVLGRELGDELGDENGDLLVVTANSGDAIS